MYHKMRLFIWKIKGECWSREVRVDCFNSPALQGKTTAGTKIIVMHADDHIFCFLWKSDNF